MKMRKGTISKYITDLIAKFSEIPIVKRFRESNPSTYLLITNRLYLNKFSGLPLTILSIAIILNLFYCLILQKIQLIQKSLLPLTVSLQSHFS